MSVLQQEAPLRPLNNRKSLHLCTAGSVDDGKSTFVGRLLHDTKSVLADQLLAAERVSRQKGLEELDLSLLVDGLRAEREQGITIDVAYRYFSTAKRTFILADTPGHVQYTRNTVTGVSTSQVVVLLVDARQGVLTQTRRHLSIAALLGIEHVVLAVNKIDLVDYSEEIFESIRTEFIDLAHAAGIAHAVVVPTSALLGDNVVERSKNTPWYRGQSVLEILEEIESEPAQEGIDFRFPIQHVIREGSRGYRGYAGRITAGSVRIGDTVRVGQAQKSLVTHIDSADGALEQADTDDSVVLRIQDDFDLSRGDLMSGQNRPPTTTEFTATAVGLSGTPLTPGQKIKIRYGTSLVRARISSLHSVIDIDTFKQQSADQINLNDIASISIQLAQALPIEPYALHGRIGSFLIIDHLNGNTLAAGLAT